MTENYLKVIEVLGEAIINKELKMSVLEYEINNLKGKIKAIEDYCDFYDKDCEEVS